MPIQYLDTQGLAALWQTADAAFVRRTEIEALLRTVADLTARVQALEAGQPAPAQQGIGYWAIGSTFRIGGTEATARGIGHDRIGTTFAIA